MNIKFQSHNSKFPPQAQTPNKPADMNKNRMELHLNSIHREPLQNQPIVVNSAMYERALSENEDLLLEYWANVCEHTPPVRRSYEEQLKQEVTQLISKAKTEEALFRLMDYLDAQTGTAVQEELNVASLLLMRLKRQQQIGTISAQNERLEENKINAMLMYIVQQI